MKSLVGIPIWSRLVLTLLCFCSLPLALNAQVPWLGVREAFPQLSTSFDLPTDIQNAGDGSNRLFVVEREGRIHVFRNTPDVETSRLFLDLSEKVVIEFETGLLGLAFHPDYKENGFFYVNYTTQREERVYTLISRFRVSQTDPDKADPASEQVILEFEQPDVIHNGGQLAFGPDGYLYIATGDGGPRTDPDGNAQNPATLLGKILCIDVDNPDAKKLYGIPGTNPFVGRPGYRGEIYALGFRNPWRMSFDPLTGQLWAGDVGEMRWEEVNLVEKGGNYGWNILEGRDCFNPPDDCDRTGLIEPVWAYYHSRVVAITGGYVYRGDAIPQLSGLYIHADYTSGDIRGLEYSGPGQVENKLLVEADMLIATFGVDEKNELYVASFGKRTLEGPADRIYKFSLTSGVEEEEEFDLQLHSAVPNPASESVEVSYSIAKRTYVTLSLFDASGRKIFSPLEGVQEGGEYRTEIDITEFPAGVYYLRLSTQGGEQTEVLMIQ